MASYHPSTCAANRSVTGYAVLSIYLHERVKSPRSSSRYEPHLRTHSWQ
jgi:hypothetical protein